MAGPLLIVQDDAKYGLVKRRGRFSIDETQATDRVWLFAAIKKMQEKMIHDMTLYGYEYQDQYDFELRGPLPHEEVSDDTRPDPGPLAGPDPLDLVAQEAWGKEEKARAARNVGEIRHLVDYQLVGVFRHRLLPTFRKRF